METTNINSTAGTTNEKVLCFDLLPMPPSVNKSLSSFRGRLIKTTVAREFESDIINYFNQNRSKYQANIEAFKKALQEKKPRDRKILFQATFFFKDDDIYRTTADRKTGAQVGEPKRKDTSNRIKPLEDRISESIGIDDKYFFQVWCKKEVTTDLSPNDTSEGFCNVRLSIINSV